MFAYILRRLLLIPLTLLGQMLVLFTLVQFVPGGPVERIIMQLEQQQGMGGGEAAAAAAASGTSAYRGSQGVDEQFKAELNKLYGFDKPVVERFIDTCVNYFTFNFGESPSKGKSVVQLIREALPVSVSLGLWLMIFSYAISIPLGIRKAVKDGSAFDAWTSSLVTIGYAIPNFLLGVLLILLFSGTFFLNIFPDRGLFSDNWETLGTVGKITDYLWHMVLPFLSLVVSSFAVLTLFTKNAFLDEIRKQYVLTARMKGLTERAVLYGHVFRNAMLIIIANFPSAFVGAFFTGALLIEILFNLNGIGLLSYTSIVDRDYPVVFATFFIFSLISLVMQLVTDLIYVLVDPRIDFATREA
ncbi:MAG: ABC transporter permease subunit [Methylobacteriaceae bacterium]|nr:ABC transporter permease subunit [Methylobacteriaceae bacterium]